MQFPAAVTVTHGTTGVNGFTHPELVPPNEVLEVPYFDTNGNPSRVAMVFDAAATKTVTVDLYCADDDTIGETPESNDPLSLASLAARRFYLMKTGLVLTAGTLVDIPGPLHGKFYISVTGDTLVSGTGVIKCGGVSSSEVSA